ncbi:MAG: hypothetical protein U0174_27855 [Polyangiaceae bacterium]
MAPKRDLEFYRAPPPPGRSRESTIRLDGEGVFHHNDEAFAHAKLRDAMHTWITRHPDDNRFILDNGYDWTYFTVEDVPYFVRHLAEFEDSILLVLSDGSREALDPDVMFIGPGDAIYVQVKRPNTPNAADDGRGPYWAKFTRHAQTALAPLLTPATDGVVDAAIRVGNRIVPIGKRENFS